MTFSGGFGRVFRPVFDPGAARNGLLNGLVAYWPLNETSGQRNDVHGTYHLSAFGSPAGRTGKLSSAVDVLATTNYLYRNNPELALRLPTNTSKTLSAWVLRDNTATQVRISLWGGAGSYNLRAVGFVLRVNNFTETQGPGIADTQNAGQWYHICGWYDHTVGTYGTAYFCVDNGTVISIALTKAYSYDPTITPFCLGPLRGDVGDGDGAIDEVGMWNRVLTPAERAALYNAGAGLTYANFTT